MSLRDRVEDAVDFLVTFAPMILLSVLYLCALFADFEPREDWQWAANGLLWFGLWCWCMRTRDNRQRAIGAWDFNAKLEALTDRRQRGDLGAIDDCARMQDRARRLSWTTDRRGAGPR